MIYRVLDGRELQLSVSELAARLKTPREHFPAELDSYIEKLASVSRPSFSARELEVRRTGECSLVLGDAVCTSSSLAKILSGCSVAFALCATLGFEAERLLRRTASLSPSAHFMLDAVADAMVEALADAAEEQLSAGLAHTARFSPGYGDLPLEFTRQLVYLTDAERLLGIKLTESLLTVPTKTVTAIIGIKDALKLPKNREM